MSTQSRVVYVDGNVSLLRRLRDKGSRIGDMSPSHTEQVRNRTNTVHQDELLDCTERGGQNVSRDLFRGISLHPGFRRTENVV
jgi:hypothetical protein